MIREDPQRDGAAISAAPSALVGEDSAVPSRVAAAWRGLLRTILLSLTGFVAVLVLFTQIGWFQRLDERARYCTGEPARAWAVRIDPLVPLLIGALGLGVAAGLIRAIARRRAWVVAAAAIVLVGTNGMTHLLKAHWPTHPHLWANSMPSGHATSAMSVALAATVVAPVRWRRHVAAAGAFTATFVGAGTVVGHWHRPADVVAAYLECLLWASLALVVSRAGRFRGASVAAGRSGLSAGRVRAVFGASLLGLVVILAGVRPLQPGMRWGEAVVSFVTIALLSAAISAWLIRALDDGSGGA